MPPMNTQPTLKETDQKALKDFREKISKILGRDLVRLALFGSKITGKDTSESDIDVFVLVKDRAVTYKDKIRDAAFEVNLKHGVYISPRIISVSTFNDPVWSLTAFLQGLREKAVTL